MPNAVYKVSMISACRFQRRFLKFYHNYTGMVAILVMWPGPFEQTFIPLSHWSSISNLTDLIGPVVSKEMFENVDDNKIVTLDQGERMILTSDACKSSCTHSVYNTFQLLHHRLQTRPLTDRQLTDRQLTDRQLTDKNSTTKKNSLTNQLTDSD